MATSKIALQMFYETFVERFISPFGWVCWAIRLKKKQKDFKKKRNVDALSELRAMPKH